MLSTQHKCNSASTTLPVLYSLLWLADFHSRQIHDGNHQRAPEKVGQSQYRTGDSQDTGVMHLWEIQVVVNRLRRQWAVAKTKVDLKIVVWNDHLKRFALSRRFNKILDRILQPYHRFERHAD